jgi:hypothetical protein
VNAAPIIRGFCLKYSAMSESDMGRDYCRPVTFCIYLMFSDINKENF